MVKSRNYVVVRGGILVTMTSVSVFLKHKDTKPETGLEVDVSHKRQSIDVLDYFINFFFCSLVR